MPDVCRGRHGVVQAAFPQLELSEFVRPWLSHSSSAVVGLAKFSRPLSPVSPEMLSCVALRFDAPGEDSEECDAVVWQRNGFPV